MKNKQALTSIDRRNYLLYQIKVFYSDFLIMAILFMVVSFFVFQYFIPSIDTIDHNTIKFYYFAFHAIIITIRFLFSKSFKVLFFKKIYTLDGHIFKRHIFTTTHHGSDHEHTTSFSSMARAVSEDGGITTKWIP